MLAGLHHDLVARVEQYQRAVARRLAHDVLDRPRRVGEHAARLGGVAERAAALEHVRERVPPRVHLEGAPLARRHGDVDVARIGGDPFDRAAPAPEAAAHHAHARAVVVGHLGNVGRGDVLVARRGHLERRGQVGPELEAVHTAGRVALRHLLVKDAAARRHPLDVARAERARVPQAVTMHHGAGEHVSDRLDAAVRVPGEALDVVGRPLVPEVVEEQERIGLGGVAEPERAAQVDARTLERRLGLLDALHGADRHGDLAGWSSRGARTIAHRSSGCRIRSETARRHPVPGRLGRAGRGQESDPRRAYLGRAHYWVGPAFASVPGRRSGRVNS